MRWLAKTTRFTRGLLPHWEVEQGRYFVTVRCHDSLPAESVARLREISDSLAETEAASPQFAQLQRRYFLTMEKYLDVGRGEAPLRKREVAEILVEQLGAWSDEGVLVPHYSIMPNHWHALLEPRDGASIDLVATMARFKGRTARAINLALERRGPLWQREWFDRWVRTDAEWERCVAYVRQNPVKVGLVKEWREHSWTR